MMLKMQTYLSLDVVFAKFFQFSTSVFILVFNLKLSFQDWIWKKKITINYILSLPSKFVEFIWILLISNDTCVSHTTTQLFWKNSKDNKDKVNKMKVVMMMVNPKPYTFICRRTTKNDDSQVHAHSLVSKMEWEWVWTVSMNMDNIHIKVVIMVIAIVTIVIQVITVFMLISDRHNTSIYTQKLQLYCESAEKSEPKPLYYLHASEHILF